MKKTMILTVGMTILGATLLGGFSQTANAAENQPSATSNATLEVKGGPLKLTSVDNIDFSQIEINGQLQEKKGNDISVKFSDYRGVKNEGFTLKVKSDDVFTENGLSLDVTPTTTNESSVTLGTKLTVSNEFKQVAYADKEQVTGEANDYELTLETGVNVFKNATAGIHQTVLTWDLSATPN